MNHGRSPYSAARIDTNVSDLHPKDQLCLQSLLCCVAQLCEVCSVVDRDLGEHLAVDVDAALLQTIDQLAVAHAVLSCCSVDSGNPQSSVLSLLHLSSNICGSERSHNCRISCSEVLALLAVETLSLLQYLLMSLMSVYTLLYSCQYSYLLNF